MHASSSLVLNATKHLAGLPDSMYLIPQSKKKYFEWKNDQSGFR